VTATWTALRMSRRIARVAARGDGHIDAIEMVGDRSSAVSAAMHLC
jgi:hypothetical protein